MLCVFSVALSQCSVTDFAECFTADFDCRARAQFNVISVPTAPAAHIFPALDLTFYINHPVMWKGFSLALYHCMPKPLFFHLLPSL